MPDHVVGVDVGTRSARAGVFDFDGDLKSRAIRPIELRREGADIFEQDSEDIWRAVCAAVRAAVAEAGIDPLSVRGIGFDATCSLVARDRGGAQVSVGRHGDDRWDTMVWMDHRAIAEAGELAALATPSGAADACSPEMQAPKAMWLKRHLPRSWARIGLLFDLVDFLTWMASGSLARSHCALTCKWPYRGDIPSGWRHDLLARLDLGDLLTRGGLPEAAVPPGTDLGPLVPHAANALGLGTQCRVGAGLVDAHAGALGVLGGRLVRGRAAGRAALIAGTSSCLMMMTPDCRAVPGLWGPYFGAVLPEFWLIEGGQSASGALLDHIVRSHPAGGAPTPELHDAIEGRIAELHVREGAELGADIIVLPDFHGNRSPFAAPRARGAIVGLSLDESFDGLCRLYWRAAIGIALGMRQILDALDSAGMQVDTMHLTGGHAASPLLTGLYADVIGRTIERSSAPDCTVLGAAMTGAVASGRYSDLAEAAAGMEQPLGECCRPQPGDPYRHSYRTLLELQAQLSVLGDRQPAVAGTAPAPSVARRQRAERS
jgi:FGGY-family pentulose kinase